MLELSYTEADTIDALDTYLPDILKEGGKVAQRLRVEGLERTGKGTGTPKTDIVTSADFAAQRLILECLLDMGLSTSEIIAEESTPELTSRFKGKNGISIALDPINGTARFASGSPSWESIVTVTSKRRVIYACMHSPEIGHTLTINLIKGLREEGRDKLLHLFADIVRPTGRPLLLGQTDHKKICAMQNDDARLCALRNVLAHPDVAWVSGDNLLLPSGHRIGRDIAFVSGIVDGFLTHHPNAYDALIPAVYAHMTGGTVLSYGSNTFPDNLTEIYRGQHEVTYTGGYLAMRE